MSINRLLELHALAKQSSLDFPHKRFLFKQLSENKGKHFVGIAGARGTGKTVLLRQYAQSHDEAFYLSADTLEPNDDTWDTIRNLHDHYGYQTLLLDEIHFLPGANALLKRLFDFLDLRVIFTSSVALAMQDSAHDLSRRVRLLELRNFSFHEYLRFTQELPLPALTMTEILDRKWTAEHIRAGQFFDAYLTSGLLPFSLDEPAPLDLLRNTVEKVIVKDIPAVARLMVDELDTIRRLLQFVGRSEIDGLNYSSLSRNLGITKYKAEQYVRLLERAFILRQVFPAGTNVLREPKVLMAPPCRLLYRETREAIGGLREDFFAEAMQLAGLEFSYLKSTRGAKTPDFLIRDDSAELVAEIGGPGKGRSQFKGVSVDRKQIFAHIPVPAGDQIPLFMLGFLAHPPCKAGGYP